MSNLPSSASKRSSDLDFWGSYSWLYEDAPSKLVDLVEEGARLFSLVGKRAAQKKYDQASQIQRQHPLFALSYSKTLTACGLHRERLALLEDVLSVADSEPIDPSKPLSSWDLLRLLLAFSEFETDGSLKDAISTASQFSKRLSGRPIASLTPPEVHCAEICQILYRHVRSNSNWLDTDQDLLETSLLLPDIRDLRRALLSQRRFNEAWYLLSTEVFICDYDTQMAAQPFREFLKSYQRTGSVLTDASKCKLSYVHRRLATYLAKQGFLENAVGEMKHGSRLLSSTFNWKLRNLIAATGKGHTNAGPLAECFLDGLPRPQRREFQALNLMISPQAGSRSSILQMCKLAETVGKESYYPLKRSLLMHALDFAKELKEKEGDTTGIGPSHEDILNYFLDFEAIMEQPRCLFYATAAWGTAWGTSTEARPGQVVALFKELFDKFPKFQIPSQMFQCAMHAAQAAMLIEDDAAFEQFKSIILTWQVQLAVYNVSEGKIEGPRVNDDENFFLEWNLEGYLDHLPWFYGFIAVCGKFLLRWVKEECKLGVISESLASKLLSPCPQALHAASPEEEISLSYRQLLDEGYRLGVKLFGENEPTDIQVWKSWYDDAKQWLLLKDRPSSTQQRQRVLKEIQRCRAASMSAFAATLSMQERALGCRLAVLEAERSLDLQETLDIEYKSQNVAEAKFTVANTINILSVCKNATTTANLGDEEMARATTLMRESLEFLEKNGPLTQIFYCLQALGQLTWQRHILFDTVTAEACLLHFSAADMVIRTWSEETRFLSPSASLLGSSGSMQRLDAGKMYTLAIRAALRMTSLQKTALVKPDEDHQKRDIQHTTWQLLEWLQKPKARALADLLGRRVGGHQRFRLMADKNRRVHDLLSQESSLLEELHVASPFEQVQVHEKLRALRNTMYEREEPLRDYLQLREGASLSRAEMCNMGQRYGANVVIIEWTENVPFDAKYMVMGYRQGVNAFRATVEGVDSKDVRNFIRGQLQEDRPLNHPLALRALKRLSPLIACLEMNTSPGETLVLCPAGDLHKIPLHALFINGSPLIERNPVVYIQSQGLLRFCHMMQEEAEPTQIFKTTIFDTKNTVGTDAAALLSIAKTLGAGIVPQARCSKEYFLERGSRSSIIHAHGHAHFDEENPLKHSLILNDSMATSDDETGEAQLTANDIFDVELQMPSLIVIMGCNSGRSKLLNCDNLIGLTAAFHNAGASAVVSAMWMVHETDCLRFSEEFYKNIAEQRRNASEISSRLHLAVALQTAIRSLCRDEHGRLRAPYHWAGITLHGSWLFPRLADP